MGDSRKTTKHYLLQIQTCKKRIRHNDRRLAELKELAMTPGTKQLKKDPVQTSLTNAGLEKSVGDYVDYERKIKMERDACINLMEMIIKQIHGLDAGENTPKYVDLLIQRYDDDLSLDDIADKIGNSPDHIRHIHREALDAFYEQYLK